MLSEKRDKKDSVSSYSEIFRAKTFFKIRFEHNWNMQTHRHPNVEFFYLTSGSALLKYNDSEAQQINARQFIIIKPNVPHRLVILSEYCDALILELCHGSNSADLAKFIARSREFGKYKPIASLFNSENSVSFFMDTGNVFTPMSRILTILKARMEGDENEFFELEYEIQIKLLLMSISRCQRPDIYCKT